MLKFPIITTALVVVAYLLRRNFRRMFYVLWTGDENPDFEALEAKWWEAEGREEPEQALASAMQHSSRLSRLLLGGDATRWRGRLCRGTPLPRRRDELVQETQAAPASRGEKYVFFQADCIRLAELFHRVLPKRFFAACGTESSLPYFCVK